MCRGALVRLDGRTYRPGQIVPADFDRAVSMYHAGAVYVASASQAARSAFYAAVDALDDRRFDRRPAPPETIDEADVSRPVPGLRLDVPVAPIALR